MSKILYIVRATCRDAAQREVYQNWLVPHHTEGMMKFGATSVRVALFEIADGASGPAIEAHYTYDSREAFDTYVREHAPAMRGDSAKHFPPDCGIVFERRLGEFVEER